MARYIVLLNFTEQGMRREKDTTRRADDFMKFAKTAGVIVTNIHWTLGLYDVIATIEASDEVAVTNIGLCLVRAGNMRLETLCAFTKTEIGEILGDPI